MQKAFKVAPVYGTFVVTSSSSCKPLLALPSLSGSRTKREGRGGVGGSSAAAYFSRWRLSVCPCAGRLLPTAPTPREVSRLTPRGQLPRSKGDVTQCSVVTSYVARRRPLNMYRIAAGRLNYHLEVAPLYSTFVIRYSMTNHWPRMIPQERRNFSAPDAIHNARWMEKAIHSLST